MRSGILWVVLLGSLAAATTIGFALASESPDGLRVFLLEWISAPFLAAGLVAWVRRPDSRLGVLMVAGGFASALSGWQLAEHSGPFTLGAVFDILPAAPMPLAPDRLVRARSLHGRRPVLGRHLRRAVLSGDPACDAVRCRLSADRLPDRPSRCAPRPLARWGSDPRAPLRSGARRSQG